MKERDKFNFKKEIPKRMKKGFKSIKLVKGGIKNE